jgi:hypothetical protein
LSSRSVFDYLSGRIDRPTLEKVVNAHPLEILRKRMDEGCLPAEVTLVKVADEDDDALSIKMSAPDPSMSPYRSNRQRKQS